MKKLIALLLISLAGVGCVSDSEEIQMVKNGHLQACPNKTVETAVNGFFGSPSWESGQSEEGIHFVTIKGDMTYMEKPVKAAIQFRVDKGTKQFAYQAFEMNDIPQNNLIAMGLISKMCE